MKTFDLYEYYSPKNTFSKVLHNCSACGVSVLEIHKISGEYMCEDCHNMHLENLAEAQDEAQTMHDLTYWGIGV